MDTTPTISITVNISHPPPERPRPKWPRVPWKALLLAVAALAGLLGHLCSRRPGRERTAL